MVRIAEFYRIYPFDGGIICPISAYEVAVDPFPEIIILYGNAVFEISAPWREIFEKIGFLVAIPYDFQFFNARHDSSFEEEFGMGNG
jgi:hypothetical protein